MPAPAELSWFRLTRSGTAITFTAPPTVPHFTDAVEIINASHPKDSDFNHRAAEYAKWYDLPVTAGSDAHSTTTRWFGGGVESPEKFNDVIDYCRAVKAGTLKLRERRT